MRCVHLLAVGAVYLASTLASDQLLINTLLIGDA
jgi:hypothetical protein